MKLTTLFAAAVFSALVGNAAERWRGWCWMLPVNPTLPVAARPVVAVWCHTAAYTEQGNDFVILH